MGHKIMVGFDSAPILGLDFFCSLDIFALYIIIKNLNYLSKALFVLVLITSMKKSFFLLHLKLYE
jgi:hypothetical protein